MMKDDFLSQVSHELRTPMTSIRSFAEILANAQDIENPQTRRFLGIIQQESERLTRLLDEILDLSRVRSEEHTSELQSLMRISSAVFCLKKKKRIQQHTSTQH